MTLGFVLGTEDVRETYRRSFVGPFWLTLGLAVQVATIGIVFSLIFDVDLGKYLPYLATSLILWNFIQFTASESCQSFISGERIIKQLPLPMMSHVFRVVWKNLFVFGHNLIVIPVVFLIFQIMPHWPLFFFPLGVAILVMNLTWLGTILGILSARFRDVPPIVQSLLTVVFYVTPVIWLPEAIPETYRPIILGLNPAYHLMEVVRQPLLGEFPSLASVIVTLTTATIGTLVAALVLSRFRSRIAFWV